LSINLPEGYGLIQLESVDNTLDEARRRVSSLAGPTWIFARQQTKARGRRGRAWHQPAGNFAATLVLPNAGPPAQAALRSFVTALALADALEGAGEAISLKWPNDVLLNDGKLAGILLEGLPAGGLAIGIGVNLAKAPGTNEVEEGALRPVSLLGETGMQLSPEDFLTRLAVTYAAREAQFSTMGFTPIRTGWLAQAAKLGQEIRVRLPHEELHGIFEDMDEDGQLVLSTAQGPRKIAAGDVFF